MVWAPVPALPTPRLSTSPAPWLTSPVHSLGHSAVDLHAQAPAHLSSVAAVGVASRKRAPSLALLSEMPVNRWAGSGQTSDPYEQSMGPGQGGRREAAPLLPERELIQLPSNQPAARARYQTHGLGGKWGAWGAHRALVLPAQGHG